MTAKFFKAIRFSVRLWYLPTIGGMAFVALGILMFYTLPELYMDLAQIFALTFLLSGFTEILFAVLNRKQLDSWGCLLAFGIFTLLIGVLLFTHPQLTAATLQVFVGCGLFFRSNMAISISFEVRNYGVKDWAWLLAIGILGAVFSFLLLLNPAFDDFTIVTWTGLAFITLGIYNIYFSLNIRRLHSMLDTISTELKLKFHKIQKDIQEALMAE